MIRRNEHAGIDKGIKTSERDPYFDWGCGAVKIIAVQEIKKLVPENVDGMQPAWLSRPAHCLFCLKMGVFSGEINTINIIKFLDDENRGNANWIALKMH